jgi:uroporphyrinogen decarboxylase
MSRSDRLLKACNLETADCTPVWFMRQAGRYMPEYRKIREKHSLMEMFKNADIAAEITLQPVRAFAVDAAIIFADILLPLEGMGIGIKFVEGEGPVIESPVRSRADAEKLRRADPEQDLGYVLTALKYVRAELNRKVPLIGFAGAPFTLACYAIEGGPSRSCLATKKIMYEDPRTWDLLMTRLAETLSCFLLAQVRAGAQLVQLFDSWAGYLSPSDYREYVLPYTRKIFLALEAEKISAIHFGTGTAGLLPLMREAGGNVLGADWRLDIYDAWNRIGPGAGIQGNLDPQTLLAPLDLLKKKAKEILDLVAGRPGHIFNLGHGILPSTPVESVRALTDFVHEYTIRCQAPSPKGA